MHRGIAILLLLANMAFAGDERFGFNTHFQQGWPTSIMPNISATGVGWIRDSYLGSDSYYTAAHQAGLKTCVIVTTAAQASTLATNGWADAIEVTNEPNNQYASQHGATWESDLVALTNSVSAEAHAINPNIPVIGLGAQGSQIINMLATIPAMDGVVYHPYGQNNQIPSSVWEPSWFNYVQWVGVLRSHTPLPLWETEYGTQTSPTFTGDNQANYLVRRLLLSAALGVEHSFIYEFKDNGAELNGVESSNPMTPKPAYAAVTNVIAALKGVSGDIASPVKVYNLANNDTADAFAFSYQGLNKTVVAFWFENHSPTAPPMPSAVSLQFTVPYPHGHSVVFDPMTGISTTIGKYKVSSSGASYAIAGLPITDHPLLLIMQ